MTWNPPPLSDYDVDSPVTQELFNRIVEAIKHGRNASGEFLGTNIADGTVPGSVFDDSSGGFVTQSWLKTATGELSGGGILPGGQYGFYPQIRHDGGTGTDVIALMNGMKADVSESQEGIVGTTSVGTSFAAHAAGITTPTATVYFRQRYIQASPPYDLGDGEIPLFTFALVNPQGDVVSTYTAEDPPWANNGPTNTRPDFYATVGKGKNQRRVGYQNKRRFNRETGEIEEQTIEVSQAVKNADMDLIPHPFASAPADHTVVLLDPPDTGWLHEVHNTGESIAELLHQGYITVDNEALSRCCPKGVQACRYRWKNSGARK